MHPRHQDVEVVVATFVALAPTGIGDFWFGAGGQPARASGAGPLGNILVTIALFLISLRGVAPGLDQRGAGKYVRSRRCDPVPPKVFDCSAGCGSLYRWPEYMAGALVISAVIYFRYFTNNIDFRILAMEPLDREHRGSGVRNHFAAKQPLLDTGSPCSLLESSLHWPGALSLFRGIYVYAYTPVTDLFAPSLANAAFFAGASLAVICLVLWLYPDDGRRAGDGFSRKHVPPASASKES